MNTEQFETYFRDRYTDQVDWYGRRASENQTRYRIMQWPVVVLAALTPVLIEMPLPEGYAHVPTFISVIVAIFTGGLQTFKYQENWLNYRTIAEALRREQYYFEARVEGYASAVDEVQRRSLFVERVEALIAGENLKWLGAQEKEKPGQTEGGSFED